MQLFHPSYMNKTNHHSLYSQQYLHLRRPGTSTSSRSSPNIPALQRRQPKSLTRPDIALRPHRTPSLRSPPQRPNPRLHIPPHRESDILPFGHLPRNISDGVLGPLVAESQLPRLGCLLGSFASSGRLLRAALLVRR